MDDTTVATKEFTYAVDETKCQACPLWQTSISGHVRRSGVYGRGSGSNGLWLYGEDLRNEDVKQGLPFTGDIGKLLSRVLKEVGIDEHTSFITNVVRCRPLKDRTAFAAEYKACMEQHASRDVPQTPPKLIMLLGALPLKAILGLQKITENRGIIFDCPMFDCKAMATYHPAKVFKDPKLWDTLKADFQKARDFILDNPTGASLPPIKKELINSKERFLAWMEILASPFITERSADIETTGLNFWKNEIVSMAFTTEIDGELYGIGFLTRKHPKNPDWWFADLNDPEIRAALQKVLDHPIDFHRGLFDVPWFWHRGINLNFGIDTMDQHLMINENSTHGLKYLVTIYNTEGAGYQLKINQEVGDPSKLSEAHPQVLLDYNIDDTYHTFILKKKFTPMVKKEGMENFFNTIQMPFERTLTKMSYRGFMMDRGGIIDLSNEYRKQIILKEEELWDTVKQKFNYASGSKELPTILYHDLKLPIIKRTETSGVPSPDKETLEITGQDA